MKGKVDALIDALTTILYITKPTVRAINPKYSHVIPPLDESDEDLARLIVSILVSNRRINTNEASEIMNKIIEEIRKDRKYGAIPIIKH